MCVFLVKDYIALNHSISSVVLLNKQRLPISIAYHSYDMSNIISRVCNPNLMLQAEK